MKYFAQTIRGCVLLVCVAGVDSAVPAGATIITFDPSGSLDTEALDVNDSGAATGYYIDGYGTHGFLRAADGTITSFDEHGDTNAVSINNNGDIAGYFRVRRAVGRDNSNVGAPTKYYTESFIRGSNGTVTEFFVSGDSTYASAINDKGVVIGSHFRHKKWHGFVRKVNGTTQSFDPADAMATSPTDINRSGVIVGSYTDNAYVNHGFVRVHGTITSFDPEGSTGTGAYGINNKGVIVGSYVSDALHGYLRAPDGSITSFDPPGSKATSAMGVDDKGNTTGWFEDSSDAVHGFVRATDGNFKTFDPPGSTYTDPLAIAAHVEVGSYDDQEGVRHGFLRTK